MQTRYEERRKKRRQNFILNSLIGIVFICIVIVGAQLVSNPSSKPESSQTPASKNDEQLADAKEEEEEIYANSEAQSFDSEESDETGEYTFTGGGPDGPWEPIGTKQTGVHVTKFEKDSLDWKEMEMAIAYGAGIDHNNMTVLWIGNGGDPQRAKGRVKSKDEPNKIYHVTIEWVDEKGWKPIEVTIEQ